MPDPNEEATFLIVRAAQAGDPDAVDRLFRRYLPVVRAIVSYRPGIPAAGPRPFKTTSSRTRSSTCSGTSRITRRRSEATFRNWVATCVGNAVRKHFRDATAAVRGGGKVRNLGALETGDLALGIFGGGPGPRYGLSRAGAVREDRELSPSRWRSITARPSCCGNSAA